MNGSGMIHVIVVSDYPLRVVNPVRVSRGRDLISAAGKPDDPPVESRGIVRENLTRIAFGIDSETTNPQGRCFAKGLRSTCARCSIPDILIRRSLNRRLGGPSPQSCRRGPSP